MPFIAKQLSPELLPIRNIFAIFYRYRKLPSAPLSIKELLQVSYLLMRFFRVSVNIRAFKRHIRALIRTSINKKAFTCIF